MDVNRRTISGAEAGEEENGSSLIAVLIIITIISFLIGSVMMGTVIQNRFIQQDVHRLQARYKAEAGLFHFLSDSTLPLLPHDDSLHVQLMDSNLFSTVDVSPFGGFLSVTSTGQAGKQSKTIRTLVGERATPEFNHAVVLGDIRSALNLTGSTSITGDIAVGPLGVKRSPFKGALFKGTVHGAVHKAEQSLLPAFDKSLFHREIALCDSLLINPPAEAVRLNAGTLNLSRLNPIKEHHAVFVEGDLELKASSEVSFSGSVTIIVTGELTLDGPISYKPFSRFVAGGNLKVSNKLRGQHGLFYSKKDLAVENEVRVSGQFIAGQHATLSESSYLRYPSIVYLRGAVEEGIREGRLELSGGAVVEGTLLIPPPEEVITEDKARLVVGEGTTVRGGIYNTAQTELHGEVSGSVLTLQFYFYHSPTAYINWLKDVAINVEDRPENYVIPLGFSENRKFEILEWQEL